MPHFDLLLQQLVFRSIWFQCQSLVQMDMNREEDDDHKDDDDLIIVIITVTIIMLSTSSSSPPPPPSPPPPSPSSSSSRIIIDHHYLFQQLVRLQHCLFKLLQVLERGLALDLQRRKGTGSDTRKPPPFLAVQLSSLMKGTGLDTRKPAFP